jgi:uncharacterized membrane protein YhhN
MSPSQFFWGVYPDLVLVCALGVAVTLAGEYRARGRLTALGKLLAASAYVGAALSLGALDSAYGRYLVVGMACCWVGDLLLVSSSNRALFLSGLLAFLAGHVVYLAAFFARGISATGAWVAALPMLAIAVLVAAWLQPHVGRRMRLPVLFYIAAITAMVVCAAASFHALGGWPLLVGAILFFVSDLSVARHRFVAPGWMNRAWGLPLYFTGQMLLAASVAF